MGEMAGACGEIVTGPLWESLVLPERHQEVLARERIARGQGPKQRETSDVTDVPTRMQTDRMRRLMRERGKRGAANNMRVLVLFAGGGGATEGWRVVDGAGVVAAVKWCGNTAAVYSANHEHPVIQADLNDWERVADALTPLGPFDLIQWSPPCQPHSRANAHKVANNPRASTMVAAAKLICHLDAPHWVMENVPGVLESPEWEATVELMESRGYDWVSTSVNAHDCGVPQRRQRIFAIGSRTAGADRLY